MTKVWLGIPVYRFVPSKALMALMHCGIENAMKQLLCGMTVPMDLPIAMARNKVVRDALEEPECTHVWFVDSDMAPAPGTLTRLLSHDVDVVSALCFDSELRPAVYDRLNPLEQWSRTRLGHVQACMDSDSSGLAQIAGIGMACTLIRTSVLRDMDGSSSPWGPAGLETWFQTPFVGRQYIGEDIFFCERLADMGVHVHVDVGLVCDHLKTYAVNAKGVCAMGQGKESKPEA